MDETGHLCERARFWASLRLDGELSELEGALLDTHLARCAGCQAVVEGFEASTVALRSESLERVAPVAIAVRRSPRRLPATIAVAVVLLLGVIGGGLVRDQVSKDAAPAPRVVAVVASFETADQLRELRRTSLLSQRRIPRDLAAEPV